MSIRFTGAVVGQRFRPPAPLIYESLGINTPLILVRQPENQYDPNAVQVFIEKAYIDEETLQEAQNILTVNNPGVDLDLLFPDPVMLGYINREAAAVMAGTMDAKGAEQYDAMLIADVSGKLIVEVNI